MRQFAQCPVMAIDKKGMPSELQQQSGQQVIRPAIDRIFDNSIDFGR